MPRLSGHPLWLQLERLRTLPEPLKAAILSWPQVYRSPYSRSYYNSGSKRWDHTPEGCLRVSDHWNFRSRGQLHCPTDRRVPNRTHWTLARWDSASGVWQIELSLPAQPRRHRPRR